MGLETAKQLSKSGAEVIIASRSEKKLQLALEEIEGKASAMQLDFTIQEDVNRFFNSVGEFDHLVLIGAGTAAWGKLEEIDGVALQNAFQNKFWGYFFSTQAAVRKIRENGSILFTIGGAARASIPGTAGVAAVNGAILSMAKTLAKELGPIRVNILSPGLVDTPAYDWMSEEEKQVFYEDMGGKLPVGRIGNTEEIAHAVIYLLENTYTTGAVLDVDGGVRL